MSVIIENSGHKIGGDISNDLDYFGGVSDHMGALFQRLGTITKHN
ncbi:hypothetical protein [Colwellia sp. 12G3]|nr:hypothetical protein [Colwellia sp. 12G3]